MRRRRLLSIATALAVVLAFAAPGVAGAAAAGPTPNPGGQGRATARHVTNADRIAAAAARARQTGQRPAGAMPSAGATSRASMAAPNGTPDYFGTVPNYANSPLPPVVSIVSADGRGSGAAAVATVAGGAIVAITVTAPGSGYDVPPTVGIAAFDGTGATATAAIAPTTGGVTGVTVTNPGSGYGGIRKFVDSLPGLNPAGANDLGQFIPLAVPDTTTYPGSDYYVIELGQYTEQLSRDLPPTLLRGYRQVNVATPLDRFSYLGPMIVAQKDRPVRVKFVNSLPTGAGGNLFLPVDTTVMGAGQGPLGAAAGDYTQNRATIHLHGGDTPWISDGTEHQWITPAGEATAYPKGVSVQNVPDMPDPGPGAMTFYYTNQQSARLMFYHDHAYGITRLNVYAGEAAGYILRDPAEQGLVSQGVIPADEVPLIIQDRTFVPGSAQLAAEDPTWSTAQYGGAGNLWFPHVYMPNQDPGNITGANPMGRWDYGPWFWPPFTGLVNGPVPNPYAGQPGEPPTIPGTPNPSDVPEGFMDTPLVNGTAYPFAQVGQKAYRFRILNASNDRTLNLQLYYAKSNGPMWTVDASGNQVLDDANAGEVPMVAAVRTAGYPASWPTDGRDGGVPDPRAVGPSMIQIGTEGGLLPAPVTLANQPVDYEYNRRSITVLNVSSKTLFLGPAERADVIVDFSNVPAGSKLILYNDAPAPVPAFDTRYDYYTGDPDQTATGGAPTTLPGYGPNTRTIMQFQVGPVPAGLSGVSLTGGGGGYTAPAVAISGGGGAGATATATGTVSGVTVTTPGAGYAAPAVTFSGGGGAGATGTAIGGVGSIAIQAPGAGYTAPTVAIGGGGGSGATATATADPTTGAITGITITSPGAGYTSAPTVTIADPTGAGASATATLALTGIAITNPGSGYATAPAVAIADSAGGSGAGAAATATLTVTGITLTGAGTGYTSAPAVTITDAGGSGTGATATATVGTVPPYDTAKLAAALPPAYARFQPPPIVPQAAYNAAFGQSGPADPYVRIQDTTTTFFNGPLTGLRLTAAGTGYTSAPAVTIAGGGGTGATATAQIAAAVGGLTLTLGGRNYDSPPAVTISGGGGSGATATAQLAPTSVASVTVTARGSGYTSAPAVTISGGGGSGAAGVATVAGGRVSSVRLTSGGSGYTSLPAISFSGGGGTGATATALLTRVSVGGLTLTSGGSGYTTAPTVALSGGGGTGAAAGAALGPFGVSGLTLTSGGSGYTSAPAVTIAGGGGAGAVALGVTMSLQPKSIIEDFDPSYGRMNAMLGVEVPRTSANVQTSIPYYDVDPPTEIIGASNPATPIGTLADGTQIWKITHNGVDTHAIHWHMFNVQVINRVGWDGAVKPPDPNELGWKDTVRMNPLEDIVVALRPIVPSVPFDLPNSVRPLDPTMPVGSAVPNEFHNVDPTNEPATVTNAIVNFGWEYVWHCHLLGHEENIMMRPISIGVAPRPASGLTAARTSATVVTLAWQDGSRNETGFTVQRSTAAGGPWTTVATGVAGAAAGTGPAGYVDRTVARGTTYFYQVIANNVVGYTQTYAAPAAGYPHQSFDSAPSNTASA